MSFGETLEATKGVPTIVDEAEAAKVLGLAVATLRWWRCRGKGPAYLKIGGKVRYGLADIALYMESRRVVPSKQQ
jgi:predicted site-specific integrase-resolvase